jgi:uncharacterized protein
MSESERAPKAEKPKKIFLFCAAIYICLIFGAWTIYVATIYPIVEGIANTAARIFLNEFIRSLIFVLPVFLLLNRFLGEKPIRFLKLDSNILKGFFLGIAAALIYAVLVVGRFYFVNGGFAPKSVPLTAWFTAIGVATIIEEIAFRGFLLQILLRFTNFWAANLLTALLFVSIHFPGWIIIGQTALFPDKTVAMAEILFLGLLLGYLFKRTESLVACIILHAANNLLSVIIFG